jgi:hypothetical protein
MRFSKVIILVMFFCLNAIAQDKKTKSEKVIYEKKTKIDFEEKEVDGKFMSPDGKGVAKERALDFDSLLDPRSSFSKELNRDSGAVR